MQALRHRSIKPLKCSECGKPRSRKNQTGLCFDCSIKRNAKLHRNQVRLVSRKRNLAIRETPESYQHQQSSGVISPSVQAEWINSLPANLLSCKVTPGYCAANKKWFFRNKNGGLF